MESVRRKDEETLRETSNAEYTRRKRRIGAEYQEVEERLLVRENADAFEDGVA